MAAIKIIETETREFVINLNFLIILSFVVISFIFNVYYFLKINIFFFLYPLIILAIIFICNLVVIWRIRNNDLVFKNLAKNYFIYSLFLLIYWTFQTMSRGISPLSPIQLFWITTSFLIFPFLFVAFKSRGSSYLKVLNKIKHIKILFLIILLTFLAGEFLVVIHELGHLIVYSITGVKAVTEFNLESEFPYWGGKTSASDESIKKKFDSCDLQKCNQETEDVRIKMFENTAKKYDGAYYFTIPWMGNKFENFIINASSYPLAGYIYLQCCYPESILVSLMGVGLNIIIIFVFILFRKHLFKEERILFVLILLSLMAICIIQQLTPHYNIDIKKYENGYDITNFNRNDGLDVFLGLTKENFDIVYYGYLNVHYSNGFEVHTFPSPTIIFISEFIPMILQFIFFGLLTLILTDYLSRKGGLIEIKIKI